jgi:hypothetical protein
VANPTTAVNVPLQTTVTAVSTAGGTSLIGPNPTRNGLVITNRSAVILTIAAQPSVPVAGTSGLGIDIAAGASLTIGPAAGGLFPFAWTAGVQGIAASATAVVTVTEF